MKYRVLGKTGLNVSEIGFGCGNIGGLMIPAPLELRLAAVQHAFESGINYFDTAAAYGDGRSETNLGEVLSELRPEIVLASKFGLTTADLTDIPGAIARSLESSLKRLRRNSLDIFQLHTPVSEAGSGRSLALKYVLGKSGVADFLDKLRSQRLVRFIGFTGLGETGALKSVVESGRFDLFQVYFNLLNPSAALPVPANFGGQDFGGLIGLAAQKRMGVVAIRVLAGGALGGDAARSGFAAPTTGGALTPGGEYELDRQRAANLGFLVQGNVASLSQAAVRFVLGQPAVSSALVGFSDLEQIDQAVACSRLGPLPQQAMEGLRRAWQDNFNL